MQLLKLLVLLRKLLVHIVACSVTQSLPLLLLQPQPVKINLTATQTPQNQKPVPVFKISLECNDATPRLFQKIYLIKKIKFEDH